MVLKIDTDDQGMKTTPAFSSCRQSVENDTKYCPKHWEETHFSELPDLRKVKTCTYPT